MARLVIATALVLVGCSDDQEAAKGSPGKLSPGLAQDFEGVYSLTARTHNTTGCELGTNILASTGDTSFVLVATNFFVQAVELVSCKPESCADVALATKAQTVVGSEYRYSFTEGGGAGNLAGVTAWSGGDNGAGVCVERSFDEFTLTRTGETVQLKRTSKTLPDAPAEDGFCFSEVNKDRKQAASAPCAELETIEARWSAALP
jgi:hypothetical protein